MPLAVIRAGYSPENLIFRQGGGNSPGAAGYSGYIRHFTAAGVKSDRCFGSSRCCGVPECSSFVHGLFRIFCFRNESNNYFFNFKMKSLEKFENSCGRVAGAALCVVSCSLFFFVSI
mgnify:CR=1 FL=1